MFTTYTLLLCFCVHVADDTDN